MQCISLSGMQQLSLVAIVFSLLGLSQPSHAQNPIDVPNQVLDLNMSHGQGPSTPIGFLRSFVLSECSFDGDAQKDIAVINPMGTRQLNQPFIQLHIQNNGRWQAHPHQFTSSISNAYSVLGAHCADMDRDGYAEILLVRAQPNHLVLEVYSLLSNAVKGAPIWTMNFAYAPAGQVYEQYFYSNWNAGLFEYRNLVQMSSNFHNSFTRQNYRLAILVGGVTHDYGVNAFEYRPGSNGEYQLTDAGVLNDRLIDGRTARSFTYRDINGDGIADWAIVDQDRVVVARGGTWTMSNQQEVVYYHPAIARAIGPNRRSFDQMDLSDLNSDGLLDVVLSSQSRLNQDVVVLDNQSDIYGNIQFSSAQTLPLDRAGVRNVRVALGGVLDWSNHPSGILVVVELDSPRSRAVGGNTFIGLTFTRDWAGNFTQSQTEQLLGVDLAGFVPLNNNDFAIHPLTASRNQIIQYHLRAVGDFEPRLQVY